MNAKNLAAIRKICTEKAADFGKAVLADVADGVDSSSSAAKEKAYLLAAQAVAAILEGEGTAKLEALRVVSEHGAVLADWIDGSC